MTKQADFHERFDRAEDVKGSSDRMFGLLFSALFVAIGLGPLVHGGAIRIWSLGVAALFLVAALAYPRVLAPLNRLWLSFGLLLHKIVNPVVMGLMFFVTVTPIGLLMRLRGKDLLRLRLEPQAKSYWIERRPPGPTSESMTHQF